MESFSKLKFFFIIIFLFCSKLNASEKIITYQQILENPGDLKLNLKYAKQESETGNYKQTISTLERLNIIYPENIEIKLYLLSILVQIDSPQQAITLINDIKLLNNITHAGGPKWTNLHPRPAEFGRATNEAVISFIEFRSSVKRNLFLDF